MGRWPLCFIFSTDFEEIGFEPLTYAVFHDESRHFSDVFSIRQTLATQWLKFCDVYGLSRRLKHVFPGTTERVSGLFNKN